MRNCDVTLNCQRTFNTHVYETSVESATAARNINNYRQVRRVSPDITTGARVNETIVVDFNTNHSSFYFAIQDETTCIAITRLIVSYHICPGQTIGLSHVPETIASVRLFLPVLVEGHCTENARTDDGSSPKFFCSLYGVWTSIGGGCHCVPGYAYNRVNGECTSSSKYKPCSGNTLTVTIVSKHRIVLIIFIIPRLPCMGLLWEQIYIVRSILWVLNWFLMAVQIIHCVFELLYMATTL